MAQDVVDHKARRRKMFVYRDAFGFDNDTLRDLAETILRRDVASLRDLDDAQVGRMLDALEGATLVVHLLGERGHDQLVAQVASVDRVDRQSEPAGL
jgi:hypothetical protein